MQFTRLLHPSQIGQAVPTLSNAISNSPARAKPTLQTVECCKSASQTVEYERFLLMKTQTILLVVLILIGIVFFFVVFDSARNANELPPDIAQASERFKAAKPLARPHSDKFKEVVEIGMTQEQVEAILGRPDTIASQSDKSLRSVYWISLSSPSIIIDYGPDGTVNQVVDAYK